MADASQFRNAIDVFLTTPLETYLGQLNGKSHEAWTQSIIEYASRTPAYLKFLNERSQDVTILRRGAGENLPEPTTKQEYIQRYPLAERCLDGNLAYADIFAVSSGTTGKSVMWPRCLSEEVRTCFGFEHLFRISFRAHEKLTLVLVCLPLGIWIGGLHSLSMVRILAAKGYKITALAPGVNRTEIRRCLSDVAPLFEQTVMFGYPPFLRDVIDEMIPSVADPAKIRIRLVLAGEAISESWRQDMSIRLFFDDLTHSCLSMYGTADAGVLGFETSQTIHIRRWLDKYPDLCARIFHTSVLPSLFQCQSDLLHVEENTAEILLSTLTMHPLFRYSIGDRGTAIAYDRLRAEILAARGQQHTPDDALDALSPTPFIVHFGRADNVIKFFGGKVYPENVANVLDESDVRHKITGRFVLLAQHTDTGSQPLTIVVEARAGVVPSGQISQSLAERIENHLVLVNSEYANYVPKKFQRPHVIVKEFMDSEFFAREKKQAYIRNLDAGRE